jgi:hypothetical protein
MFISFLFFTSGAFIYAQDEQTGTIGSTASIDNANSEAVRGFRRRAVIVDIDARVLEDKQVVIWNETHRRVTIPGNPVGLKLVGANIVVAVQFTPYIRRSGNVLVAQGQIWVNDPDKGMSYYTSIQTIPMEFGEPIYFFPLGSSSQPGAELRQAAALDASIEIIITVNPNTAANTGVTETAANRENDN